MRSFLVTIIIVIEASCAFADTLTVKVDGSGDYPYIQNAVGWSSSGDVILVYPGTYYENIDCFGRDSLTIASLYLINPVDSNLHNTIINGKQEGSCFVAFRGEQDLRFVGLTITNAAPKIHDGLSDFKHGSGFYLHGVTVSIEHCTITGNRAGSGGGIYSSDSQVFLSKTKIIRNQAYVSGGGIWAAADDIIFDTIDLCDLYLNYASMGTDCFLYEPDSLYSIILDTATLLHPDHYYFRCGMYNPIFSCEIGYEINHAKIQDVSADVYLSPSGNDSNSGLTPADPLKTLSFALLKVKSDSLQLNTIYLGNGVYSPSNGNMFPIGFKSYVPIVGEDAENTVIDLDSLICFGNTDSGEKEIILKNFTVKNGMGDSVSSWAYMTRFQNSRYVLIENLNFLNCTANDLGRQILYFAGCDSVFIKNSTFKENHIADIIYFTHGYGIGKPLFVELSGCRIAKNFAYSGTYGLAANTGVAIYSNDDSNYVTARIINCEISGNNIDMAETREDDSIATIGIRVSDKVKATIVNSTIADHYTGWGEGAGLYVNYGAEVHLYNSILSGNEGYQIITYGNRDSDTTRVNIYNSLVREGENGILNKFPEYTVVYYDSTNIEDDPGWVNSGDFPYVLTAGSPCIDAGSQYLPEGIVLPMTDLAGGPRISGSEVDMGAYEFLFIGIIEDGMRTSPGKFNASPNPFHDRLNITFSETLVGKQLELCLYEITGNIVAEIYKGELAGTAIYWNTSNIGPGVYIMKLTSGSSLMETRKIIKI